MNREQFIAQLARLLQDLPPAERQEAIRYYQEYFDDAGEENEDAVIQVLGSPRSTGDAKTSIMMSSAHPPTPRFGFLACIAYGLCVLLFCQVCC